MTDREQPAPLSDDTLDSVQAGIQSVRPDKGVQSEQTYIGETEKSVWKAPAGQKVTHDLEFESWSRR